MEMTPSKRSKRAHDAVLAAAASAAKYYYKKRLDRCGSRRGRGSRRGSRTRIRTRRTIQEVFEILGPFYFKRAFRMTYQSFKKLQFKLRGYIVSSSKKFPNRSSNIINGPIYPELRLGCALRYFAGGSPVDIMALFGVGHTDVLESIWYVVDAVNQHPEFKLEYPDSPEKQASIAAEFRSKSGADFDCCAGAIDGILIWIHRPTEKECEKLGVASGKFFCSRKHKFGLNCQAVGDARGRILDISIMFPGSTSDCLSFEGSTLFQRLEAGVLPQHLCLFGDNAYINSIYMATPYAGVMLDASKDAYNFYHSQLRIRVECAFGMLTDRWSILRRAIPRNITVTRTIALVCSLARLHNFCISETDSLLISPLPAQDSQYLEASGACPLEQRDGVEQALPMQLLGGGHHFDDVGRSHRVARQRDARRLVRDAERSLTISVNSLNFLPRDRLLVKVQESALSRPTPLPRRH